MTVRELGNRLDSKELAEWDCFFDVKYEMEKEIEKRLREEREKGTKQLEQSQITNSIMTAGAYSKARKK